MCRGRSVTYVLALAWVPKCVLELWLAHFKNFKPKVCITGASSVINVDSYDEAALEETKLANTDCKSSGMLGQVAGTAVGVSHLRYGSRVPYRGAFQFCFQNMLPNSLTFPLVWEMSK